MATTIDCPFCGTRNPLPETHCRKCRQMLKSGDDFDMSTVNYQGPLLGTRGPNRKSTPLGILFAKKKSLMIGRFGDCDLVLTHPMISRWHALLEQFPDGHLQLTDLGSINGVWVNGKRITSPIIVQENTPFAIGPFLFSTSGGQLRTIDSSQGIRLEARHLDKVIRAKDGKDRHLLTDINLTIEPGEFVSLLGPSGSGKSTLMDCLNGRRWATRGQVLANNEDFYRYFDSFRQSLGYVPQKDIVHTQLTVYSALYYTARLRLPTDTDREELESRLFEVLQLMELVPHRDTLIGNLSGGQVKRVSLGAELLARPSLLYIDEATSGLDAGTEARMMRLFRQLADDGRSLVCITHNVENVDTCHLASIVMRGRLVYFGPPANAPGFFGVSRITEIYDRLGQRESEEWESQFRCSEFHQEFVEKRRGREQPSLPAAAPTRLTVMSDSTPGVEALAPMVVEAEATRFRPKKPPLWHQFHVLMARYASLMLSDSRSLRLIFLQAPAVALILIIGFANKPYERTQPRLRHLTKPEKEVLYVLKAIEQDLSPVEANATSAAKLDEVAIQFKIEKLGVMQSVNASGIRDKILSFQQAPLDSPLRKQLESISIEIITTDAKLNVDLQYLTDLQRLLRDQQLPSRLLALNEVSPVVPGKDFIDPTYTYMLLFIVVIIVLWFGCNNAAKEIVKEEAIYGRERAVNLGILPYLASKFLMLSLLTIFQALLLMVMVFGALEAMHYWNPASQVPPLALRVSYPAMFGVLAVLSMAGVALGLLLSAAVSSTDRATTLLPYVLIPQIILGGGTLPVKEGILYYLAFIFSPAYWAFRGVRMGVTELPDYTGYRADYLEDAWFACAMLALQMMVFLILTALCLRTKDQKRA